MYPYASDGSQPNNDAFSTCSQDYIASNLASKVSSASFSCALLLLMCFRVFLGKEVHLWKRHS